MSSTSEGRFEALLQKHGSTLFYVVVALFATAPAWIVKHPPLQDLPFHLATIRVVHDFGDPQLGFAQHYVLTFGRTQYVLYYLLGSILAYPLGVHAANVVLLSVYLGGTPLAIRALLRALGRDERLCLFSIPILVNVMFSFGLLPFIFGIPLMFTALWAAVRHFDAPTPKTGAILGVLVIGLFYAHIFPFGLFAIGTIILFPWTRPERWIRAALPYVPGGIAATYWLFFTEPGKAARGAAKAAEQAPPLAQAIANAWMWTGEVFRDQSDEAHWIVAGAVAVLSLGLATAGKSKQVRGRALIAIPLLCVVMYFTQGESRGAVWLFCQRFPILFLFTVIPFLRLPQGWLGTLCTVAILGVSISSVVNVCKHYVQFEREEVGEIDEACDALPYNSRTAALIYDKGSGVVHWAPFLHFGSYCQLRRGGLIQFSYAGWSHWPFDYKPGAYPPAVTKPPLRWEWMPEGRDVQGELVPNYDHVVTRGGGFRPPPGTYRTTYRGGRWAVWEREPGAR